MFRLSRTVRTLIAAVLIAGVGLAGLSPALMAAASADAGASASSANDGCCCGTAEGTCCGMGCCLSRQTPVPDPTPFQQRESRVHADLLIGITEDEFTPAGDAGPRIRPVGGNRPPLREGGSLQAQGVRLDT